MHTWGQEVGGRGWTGAGGGGGTTFHLKYSCRVCTEFDSREISAGAKPGT